MGRIAIIFKEKGNLINCFSEKSKKTGENFSLFALFSAEIPSLDPNVTLWQDFCYQCYKTFFEKSAFKNCKVFIIIQRYIGKQVIVEALQMGIEIFQNNPL